MLLAWNLCLLYQSLRSVHACGIHTQGPPGAACLFLRLRKKLLLIYSDSLHIGHMHNFVLTFVLENGPLGRNELNIVAKAYEDSGMTRFFCAVPGTDYTRRGSGGCTAHALRKFMFGCRLRFTAIGSLFTAKC